MTSHSALPRIIHESTVPPIVVMGVTSSGKSTVGMDVAAALGIPFADGDDLHPEANKAKMRAGNPLNDADRLPWLHLIGEYIEQQLAAGQPVVVACSALKRSYRDLLRGHVPSLVFVHLTGPADVILERMRARSHEFMPTALLTSQLATLEPLEPDERAILADITATPAEIVAEVEARLPEFVDEALSATVVSTDHDDRELL
jgi:gluconokinase